VNPIMPRRWVRAGALAAAAASIVLLFARSWRIDYPYSIDFQVYWLAGSRVAAGDSRSLYDPGGGPEAGVPLTMARNEFKNLPIVAGVFVPLAALDYLEAKRAFWWIGLASLLGTGVLLGRFVLPEALGDAWIRTFLAVAGVCSVAPAHTTLRHGQTTAVVTLVLAGYAVAQLRRREALAGALLGAASIVKLPALALAALEALRRRFRTLGAWLAVVAGTVAVSVAALGTTLHGRYAHGLLEHAGTVMTGHNNQSIAAVVHRLSHVSDPYAWEPRPLPRGDRIATAVVTAVLALVLWRGLLAGGEPDPDRFRLEFPAVLAFGIVALPVAWDHYFLLLVPGLASLAAGLRDRGLLAGPAAVLTLGAAFLLLAVPTPQGVLDASAGGGVAWSLWVSHYFFGAVAVLALAVWGARSPGRRHG
jgi:hypothetical protein